MSHEKQQWGSRLGVILAVSGSAVGLGNFLRFPGNAAQNGGGAFMIPYFIALLLVGIPIGWAEWTMGRYGGRKGFHSAPAILGVWGKGAIARFMGAFGVLIPLVVYFYYVMIESWCLRYALGYATGSIGIDGGAAVDTQVAQSTDYFGHVAGMAGNGFIDDGAISSTVWFWLITSAINIYFIFRGLSGGIEKFCRLAMPVMALCALIVLFRVLTLGTPDPALPDQNVAAGLNFMWNPDWSALKNPQTWLAACGQIFFSLSVGFGVIINYASYMRKKDDVVLSGLTAASTNEFFEVALGGMITLTASVVFLGVAATAANTGGTFSTGFFALPVVFAHMPLGNLFGATWFFMLFLAAITSSLSMLQPTKAFFEEALGVSRNAATAIVATLCLAGNVFVLYFSKNLTAMDTLDFWVGTFMIFVVAGTQIICFGWVFGVDKGLEEAHRGAQMRIPGVFRFIIKYVSPTFLLAVFGLFLYFSAPGYVRTTLGDDDTYNVAVAEGARDGAWWTAASAAGLPAAPGEPAEGEEAQADPFAGMRVLFAGGAEPVNTTTVPREAWAAIDAWGARYPGWDGGAPFEYGPVPPNKDAIYAWIVILSMIALIMVMIAVGQKRWRAAGMDLDGSEPAPDLDQE